MQYIRSLVGVLLAVSLTAIALYAGVQLASSQTSAPVVTTAVSSAGQTYICPKSGCVSPACHAASGIAGGAMMVCPTTDCSASSCHGAEGLPPPR